MRRPEEDLATARRFGIRAVPLGQPLRWLRRGWADFRRCPLPGLLHGAAAATFGAVLVLLAGDRFWLLCGAFSGFLLVAPVLATALYAVSRDLEHGKQATLRRALRVWRPEDARLVIFGIGLAGAGTAWVLTSASLVTGFAQASIDTPRAFLQHVVLAPTGYVFEIWLVLGGVLAAPVFASSVVALPLLLDQRVGVLAAVFISWRAVMANPVALALWAGLIMGLTLLGMATLLLGLVVIVPWLAHASWHAYRDLIELPPDSWADRPAG